MAKIKKISLPIFIWLFFFSASLLTCFQAVIQPQLPVDFPSTNNKIEKINQLENELEQWEETIDRFPDYPDAYLQASLISFQLKKKDKAYRYLQLAQQLAPNHPELKKILLSLEKKTEE
ncbi:hypothetical protein MUP65_03100 [Patescibacteria group bacterium]|nr:hypothetical protein [Patescibacteria group bacterium]